MNYLLFGITASVIFFVIFQMIVPFPFGLILGTCIPGLLMWYVVQNNHLAKHSLLNYRRVDPINKREKNQNDEALRILEKKYIEEKISKQEYLKNKKEFEKIEYHPRKCSVCGCDEFEFVSKERLEEPGEFISEIGYYKCKRCGSN